MTTKEIVNIIESEYPKYSQEIWDNSGLLIDNDNAEINGILICFDITEDTINEAIERNCNFIISHHPLFFAGVKKIDYLILTHGDYDHMGEANNLVENFKVEKVIFNCGAFNDLEKEKKYKNRQIQD